MTKNFLQDRIFVSNHNFTTIHVKIIENSRFFQVFFLPKLSNSRFFGHPDLVLVIDENNKWVILPKSLRLTAFNVALV